MFSPLVSSRGAQRRLQALVCRGWAFRELARQLETTLWTVQRILSNDQVTVGMFERIDRLYEQLWDKRPPMDDAHQKRAFAIATRYAARRGWVPPLAWDDIDTDPEPPVVDVEVGIDELAVELAVMGQDVKLTPAERREVVRQMHAKRWSDRRMAAALRVDLRTLDRIRGELQLPAVPYAEQVQLTDDDFLWSGASTFRKFSRKATERRVA